MYILQGGQIVRPSPSSAPAPTQTSGKKMRIKKLSKFSKRCRQLLTLLIILLIVYVFTCSKCKEIFNLLRMR